MRRLGSSRVDSLDPLTFSVARGCDDALDMGEEPVWQARLYQHRRTPRLPSTVLVFAAAPSRHQKHGRPANAGVFPDTAGQGVAIAVRQRDIGHDDVWLD